MIPDVLLRWIVTVLFALSAAECAYALATGRRVWTHVVAQSLHLVMAVAMAAMAWPWGAALPTTGPMVFFVLATSYFVVVVFAQAGHRGINAYHASMMLAMAWMYAVMSGGLLPVPVEGVGGSASAGHHGSSSSMPGMTMPGGAGPAQSAEPPFVVGLNWLCTVGFAAATLWWLYRLLVARKAEPTQPSHRVLGSASQAMMGAGMAAMFGVML